MIVHTLFNARLWLIALLIAFAVMLASKWGTAWAPPNVNNWQGLSEYPNQDCGQNYFLLLNYPGANKICLRGGISTEELDRKVEERHPGTWDLPFDDPGVDDAIYETLDWLTRLWGALPF